MNDVDYRRPSTVAEAIRLGAEPGAAYVAGGTNLIDLMKGHVALPMLLVDVNRLPLEGVVARPEGGIRIGALVRNSDLANHPIVRERYPLLAQALVAGASPQLRNMARVGGNLLQRTRCHYFVDPAFAACNKRAPGSACAALDGRNRIHAILGASDACVATHPSDMCVALAALRADVVVQGTGGERRIAIARFHRLPGDAPERDTELAAGELITAVELPPLPFAARSHYLKVRDRASYAFALVSVACALDVAGGTIRGARLALGGVGTKPWRAESAEAMLVGKPPREETYRAAAEEALRGAAPRKGNAFKVDLAKRSIVRALGVIGGGA